MVAKWCVVPVLAGMLGMSVVGCGAHDDGDRGTGEGASGLISALSGAPASAGEQSLTYRDVDVVRRLVAADRELYAGLEGFGVWELSGRRTTAAFTKESYGFGAKDVNTSLMVGTGQAQRLTGTFDVEAARKAMEKRGYRASDRNGGVRLSTEGADHLDRVATGDLPAVGQGNVREGVAQRQVLDGGFVARGLSAVSGRPAW
ncbi:hypothetical protein ACIRF8_31930 [Streptomyces sp. NPDC102406]|uniref:hypothetical protein n=1 Tax=Streptomyces sp. NPDC102406 TaxID=3366171 RepID=UPI0037F86C97